MKYAVMILFLSAGFSIAADDAESKKLLKDLEGSYKATSADVLGKAAPDIVDLFQKASFKGDKFTITGKDKDGKTQTKVRAIAVDATKKPVHIDLKEDSDQKGDQTVLGIIAIDGDTIKICFSESSGKKSAAN